jgi:hypothetical protein
MRLLLLFPLAAGGLLAQTFVNGRVLDAVTGEPVANAYITAGGRIAGDPASTTTTDAAGHFRAEVRNNQLQVQVKRYGYLDYWRGSPIQPGQAPPEIRVLLVPQAVISGRVVDENGLPVRGARVTVLQPRVVNGKRQLREWRGGTETNELGEYRLFDLPAGRYYLGFTPGQLADWDPRYNARLYPDATDVKDAQPVVVKAGEEAGGRDFRLSRQEGVTVSGHLVRPDEPNTRVTLVFASTEQPDYLVAVKQTGDAFTISHVPPGTYTLRNWRAPLVPRIGDLTGELTLQLGSADIRDVSLEIRPIAPQDIAGTIVFQGQTKPGPMVVTLQRTLGESKSVVSNADGTFVLKGILPGQYFLDVRNAGGEDVPQTDGWAISAQCGGQDALTQWFDIGNDPAGELKITVAAPVAKVNGKLLDAAGQPIGGGRVLFVSRAGGIKTAGFAADDGTFTALFLEAGEQRAYLLSPTDDWTQVLRDPDFPGGRRSDFPAVQIAAGVNAPLVLRVPSQ